MRYKTTNFWLSTIYGIEKDPQDYFKTFNFDNMSGLISIIWILTHRYGRLILICY